MVTNLSLNCQPLALERKYNNSLSFGSDEKAKKSQEQEVSEKPAEPKPKKTGKSTTFKSASKNFINGMWSPVKKVIDGGAEGLAIAGTVLAASYLVVKHLGNKIKPVIAVFATLGALKFGKGAYEVASNVGNAEKQDKGFYKMGQGTTSIGLSLWGANATTGTKAAVQAETTGAKIGAKVMQPIKALGECFKATTEGVVKNWQAIAKDGMKVFEKAKAGQAINLDKSALGTNAKVTGGETWDLTNPISMIKAVFAANFADDNDKKEAA